MINDLSGIDGLIRIKSIKISELNSNRGLRLFIYAPRGRGSSLLYISIAYYMQNWGGGPDSMLNCVRTLWKAPQPSEESSALQVVLWPENLLSTYDCGLT